MSRSYIDIILNELEQSEKQLAQAYQQSLEKAYNLAYKNNALPKIVTSTDPNNIQYRPLTRKEFEDYVYRLKFESGKPIINSDGTYKHDQQGKVVYEGDPSLTPEQIAKKLVQDREHAISVGVAMRSKNTGKIKDPTSKIGISTQIGDLRRSEYHDKTILTPEKHFTLIDVDRTKKDGSFLYADTFRNAIKNATYVKDEKDPTGLQYSLDGKFAFDPKTKRYYTISTISYEPVNQILIDRKKEASKNKQEFYEHAKRPMKVEIRSKGDINPREIELLKQIRLQKTTEGQLYDGEVTFRDWIDAVGYGKGTEYAKNAILHFHSQHPGITITAGIIGTILISYGFYKLAKKWNDWRKKKSNE